MKFPGNAFSPFLSQILQFQIVLLKLVIVLFICAFEGCSKLTNITIPDSVTKIDSHAFEYCSSLINITIPNIRNVLFGKIILNGIKLHESIKILINNTFIELVFNTIIIPNNTQKILCVLDVRHLQIVKFQIVLPFVFLRDRIFPCEKRTVTEIPNSVTEIGEYAFS